MMFPMVLPLPRTSASPGTGPLCFLAQTGSADIASGLIAGGFPSKITVPETDDAARAAPGHIDIDIATSPAASHTLFPRMFGSLVIANLVFPSSPSTLISHPGGPRQGCRTAAFCLGYA